MANSSEFVDWNGLLRTLHSRLWLVFACILVSGGSFATYAMLAAPVYRATTILVPASSGRSVASGALGALAGSLGGLADLAGIGGAGIDPSTNEAIAVLKSRAFTEEFIDKNGLMDILLKKLKSQEGRSLGRAARMFDQRVRTVTMDGKTGLVLVHVDWSEPVEAAKWANDMIERLNLEMRRRALSDGDKAMAYLRKEVETTPDIATREVLSRLIEGQAKSRMFANVTEEYAFKVVDRAMAPELDERLKPKRKMLMLMGLFIGFVLGVGVALLVGPSSKSQGA
jgi:uncharacterized protein involved in exopolysaccharide biosynthesis